jgi:hypothetical protein
MPGRTPASWLVPTLLTIPLLAVAAWTAVSWVRGGRTAVDPIAPAAARRGSPGITSVPGFPPPEVDLPVDHLEDRVDGAAEFLRGLGCSRLVYWRLAEPAADLELLVFRDPAGAGQALAHDAGPERTPGPGEEAQVGPQALYFRRGPFFVRMFADPGAPADPAMLARRAGDLDKTLRKVTG